MSWSEKDYLEITVDQARVQWQQILARPLPAPGSRQGAYLPVETLLTNAATVVVKGNSFGGANVHRVGEPVPSFSRLFKRPLGSLLRKMSNIDGSSPNGARNDRLVGQKVDPASPTFSTTYHVIFEAARSVGIHTQYLPDFLGLELGASFQFLGQEALTSGSVERVLEREMKALRAHNPHQSEEETEVLFLMNARRGQHRFAKEVIHNCGGACVFCGMTNPRGSSQSLLIASHIKPWRHGTSKERLDFRNGVAACPTHDRAFDTGLLTLTKDLAIELSPQLRTHIRNDPAAQAAFGSPPLKSVINLDWREKKVAGGYVQWHRDQIFQMT